MLAEFSVRPKIIFLPVFKSLSAVPYFGHSLFFSTFSRSLWAVIVYYPCHLPYHLHLSPSVSLHSSALTFQLVE